MPRKTPLKPPGYIAQVRRALRTRLAGVGVTPTLVRAEPLNGTKLYRFAVIAPKFARLQHIDRQELVWRVVNNELDPAQRLFITSILTLTPAEAAGE